MERAAVPTPEVPVRASWSLQPAHWSAGLLVIDLSATAGDEVVCFAPPGTALYDEQPLELATWRRGAWTTHGEFLSRRPPIALDSVSFSRAASEIPGDFVDWARSETASHIEMLRAFAVRRPQRQEIVEAARRLSGELEALEPEAIERCRGELDVFVARSELRRRRALRPVAAWVESPSTDGFFLRSLVVEALLMMALYAAYRLVRPTGPVSGLRVDLGRLTPEAVFGVLMWSYGNVHVLSFFVFMAWVFYARPTSFRYIRNATIVTAVLTVLPYLLLQGSAYPRNADHDLPSSAVPTMPALHLAVGVVIGIWGVMLCRGVGSRILWATYPLIALSAVIASEPKDPVLTIAGTLLAVVLGLMVATLAGRVRGSWRGPPLRALRLPRLLAVSLRYF